MDEDIEVFRVHDSSLGLRITIHPARKAKIALLLTKKVTTPAKCLDFANVFYCLFCSWKTKEIWVFF